MKMLTRNKIEKKSSEHLSLNKIKSIDASLIGNYENIEYPARRQFPNNDIVERWKQNGHWYVNYTGMIREEYRGVPKWCHNIVNSLKKKYIPIGDKWYFMKDTSLSLYRMPPGTIMPEHEDTYPKFKELFSENDPNKICRVLVFLDDWKSGHYFELDRKPYVNWSKGNYVYWRGETPHIAANLGVEDRYTMQITATLTDGGTKSSN